MTRLALFVTLLTAGFAPAAPLPRGYLLGGGSVRLGEEARTRAVVVVFLGTECPVSLRYMPTLNRLYDGRGEGVEFYGVLADPSVTRAVATKFAEEYGPKYPLLFDAAGDLAARLRPTQVPEAFVLTPEGEVAYRGRIDDAYLAPSKPKGRPESHDLADAIAAVRDGKTPPANTKPVGCFAEWLPEDSATLPAKVNYARHIAPLLHAACARCHRPGEVAPFSLLTFADASKRAKQIARVAVDGAMPPWKAEPGYGRFLDEMHLTDREKRLLAAWAEAGAPEGNAAETPPAPTFADGWQLGKPDLVLRMPEAFEVPADGPDELRNFVLPVDIDADKRVSAIEFRPGNRRVVHHALCYLDASGAARKLDAADPLPGYSASKKGLGFFPSGSLAGWAPGTIPRFLPDGVGRVLKKGSDAVLQVHYHPSGKPEKDRSEVGVWFARKPAPKAVAGFALENWEIDIPPGAADYRKKTAWTLPVDATVLGVAPHMHKLGKSMRAWAVLPGGEEVPLVRIRDWDFDWQDYYVYRRPVRLPKGARLHLEATFDNSAGTQRVRFGEGTDDEMCLCIFEATCDSDADLLKLVGEDIRHRRIFERALWDALKSR